MLVPQGIGTLLSRSVAGRLTDKIGARPVAVAGFVIVDLATIPFTVAGRTRTPGCSRWRWSSAGSASAPSPSR
jgi:MFS family permease